MPKDIRRSVVAADLEVAVVRSEPTVDEFGDDNRPWAEDKDMRFELAAVSRAAFDVKAHGGSLTGEAIDFFVEAAIFFFEKAQLSLHRIFVGGLEQIAR
jgi:hypothetical protein